MDRNCNKCIHHTSGSCSAWECKGTVTVEDVKADAIDEAIHSLDNCVATCHEDYIDGIHFSIGVLQELKEQENE